NQHAAFFGGRRAGSWRRRHLRQPELAGDNRRQYQPLQIGNAHIPEVLITHQDGDDLGERLAEPGLPRFPWSHGAPARAIAIRYLTGFRRLVVFLIDHGPITPPKLIPSQSGATLSRASKQRQSDVCPLRMGRSLGGAIGSRGGVCAGAAMSLIL